MADIIVTTPLKNKALAEAEAQDCIDAGGGFYFRTFRARPRELAVGSRIFYVEDGFVVGFATVSEIKEGRMKCGTSGHDWGEGYHFLMQADSWKWIRPVPMKGFQGWRYSRLQDKEIKIVGAWLD